VGRKGKRVEKDEKWRGGIGIETWEHGNEKRDGGMEIGGKRERGRERGAIVGIGKGISRC